MGVKLPATGTGDATPTVATEKIAGSDFQLVKLIDGTAGASQGAVVDASGNVQVSLAKVAAGLLVGASIPNFPATQPVSGYVGASVANLPGTYPISVASTAVVQPVSGYIGASLAGGYVGASISNLPATQPVSGYLGASIAGGYTGASIANLPAVQPVSGYLGASLAGGYAGASVANFPTTQAVSGYLGASLAGGYVGASLAGAASIAGGQVTVSGSTINAGGSVIATGGSVTAYTAAATSGGASPFHFITGASVNNVNVKNAAGTLYTLSAMNVNGSPRFLRLYDKSTVPSVGLDVPAHTFIVPGSAQTGQLIWPVGNPGLLFATGIGVGVTGGSMGDTDKTVTALGDVVVNVGYK